jgi:hypothetical protein
MECSQVHSALCGTTGWVATLGFRYVVPAGSAMNPPQ